MRIILLFFITLFTLKINAQVSPPPPPAPGDTAVSKNQVVMPQFPGGQDSLSYYIAHTIRYPMPCREDEVGGTVWVSFVVDKTGAVTNVKVAKGVNDCNNLLDKEAVRVVSGMPLWIPATSNGRAVNCPMSLPIKFLMQ